MDSLTYYPYFKFLFKKPGGLFTENTPRGNFNITLEFIIFNNKRKIKANNFFHDSLSPTHKYKAAEPASGRCITRPQIFF